MKKQYKKIISIIIGIIISIVSLYFAFRGIDLKESLKIIKEVNIKYVTIAVIISNVVIALRALRWGCFIPIEKKIKKSNLIASVYIGYMANNIFPAKLGEVIRAYVLGAKENISKTTVIASVVTERLFDLITGVIMLALSIIFIPSLPISVIYGALALFAISIIAVLGLMFITMKRELAFAILNKILSILPEKIKIKINEIAHKFIDGIGFKKDKKSIFLIFFYTITYWSGQSLACFIMLKAFNIEATMGLSLFVIAASGFGFAIPSAPAGVGPFEWVIIFALTLVGINKTLAASFAIVYHMMGVFPIIIIGIIATLFLGVNLKSAAQQPDENIK